MGDQSRSEQRGGSGLSKRGVYPLAGPPRVNPHRPSTSTSKSSMRDAGQVRLNNPPQLSHGSEGISRASRRDSTNSPASIRAKGLLSSPQESWRAAWSSSVRSRSEHLFRFGWHAELDIGASAALGPLLRESRQSLVGMGSGSQSGNPVLARHQQLLTDSACHRMNGWGWSRMGRGCLLPKPAGTQHHELAARCAGGYGTVAFSPDGERFAIASSLGYARVWRTAHLAGRSDAARLSQWRCSVVFSPDGQRLATGGSNPDDAVKLWDVDSWQELLTLEGTGHAFQFSRPFHPTAMPSAP